MPQQFGVYGDQALAVRSGKSFVCGVETADHILQPAEVVTGEHRSQVFLQTATEAFEVAQNLEPAIHGDTHFAPGPLLLHRGVGLLDRAELVVAEEEAPTVRVLRVLSQRVERSDVQVRERGVSQGPLQSGLM
ncbi:MAG: hypothetical protein IPG96_20475 [Proteobacteria bacterium]|nr:hypothetical protein [Pseudomonadota bacterium]